LRRSSGSNRFKIQKKHTGGGGGKGRKLGDGLDVRSFYLAKKVPKQPCPKEGGGGGRGDTKNRCGPRKEATSFGEKERKNKGTFNAYRVTPSD